MHSFLLNNQILNKEYDEINEYFYSTIDEVKLNQTFMSYYNSLDSIFNNYMTIINEDLNDYHFYNAFSYSIKNLYEELNEAYKNEWNNENDLDI